MALNIKQGAINFQFSQFIFGARRLVRQLKKLAGKDIVNTLDNVFSEHAEIVYAKSQILVPVDTGALKQSGIIEKPSREKLLWRVSYGKGNGVEAPHARVIHDGFRKEPDGRITWFTYHTPGTQSHYLQQPFEEELPNLQTKVFHATKGIIEIQLSQV